MNDEFKSVVLPAAGKSTRFGGSINKLFQSLAGMPVLFWTLQAFAKRDDVRQIVVPTSDFEAVGKCSEELPAEVRSKIKICAGGTCRAESVRAGTLATDHSVQWIVVHDAARPLVSNELIDRVFAAAKVYGAAAAALPAHLTIKQAVGPLPAPVQKTLPRHELWAMQTPQIMRRADLLAAFESCPIPPAEVTDDVQLLELNQKPVWLVQGEERNQKKTTAIDLQIAESLMSSIASM